MKKVVMWFNRLKSCLVERRTVFAGQLRCFKRKKRYSGVRNQSGTSSRRPGIAKTSALGFFWL
jgi:hypothetical protein